jgi:DNA polymerase
MARYFPNVKISKIHGQAKEIDGRVVIPMYHPAAALHQPSLRQVVKEDFSLIPAIIDQRQSASLPQESDPIDPEQLSLF